jgi:hypothetical protein
MMVTWIKFAAQVDYGAKWQKNQKKFSGKPTYIYTYIYNNALIGSNR